MNRCEARSVPCRVRVSRSELAELRSRAAATSLSLSAYVRMMSLLPALPIGEGDEPPSSQACETIVLLDRRTALALLAELRRWGSQYNQAVKALNAVAAGRYLRDEDAERVCDGAIALLAEISDMQDTLAGRIDALMAYAVAIG